MANKYTKEFIINKIISFYDKEKKVPSVLTWSKLKYLPNHKTIKNIFGSWNNAIKESGLRVNTDKKMDSKCIFCGSVFKYYTSSGVSGDFCSHNCYTENIIKDTLLSGKANEHTYRNFGLFYYGNKCEICGDTPFIGYVNSRRRLIKNINKNLVVLQVHHIDENRKNNNLDNLCVLCPNCHVATHHKIYTDLKRVDGKLTYNKLSVEQWTDLRHKKYIKK